MLFPRSPRPRNSEASALLPYISAVADVRRRLRDGGAAYGPLDARLDPRRWVDEAVEELLDALVYLECEIMRREAREEEEVQR